MADENKPLSDLVAQGWEILHYAASNDTSGAVVENFLLRRQKAHRILSIRPKMMGTGYVVKELDV